MKRRKVIAADLFCGAGGTSLGLSQACNELDIDLDLLAVNHWGVAIETHTANHPNARHICLPIDQIKPEVAVPGGRLHLLVASPECTHFSRARGGKPMSDQSRASAWNVLDWAQKLYIDNILIENVQDFRTWGPLGVSGRPLKREKGKTYLQFLEMLRSLGYRVEDRVLNTANYGDPTTRERLFIIARRNGKKIVWPDATHASREKISDMFSEDLKPWRPAREIIDWSQEGKSIFSRKKPLALATLKRIEAGLVKFGGKQAEPFIVVLRNHMNAVSLDQPLPTITTSGSHFGLCEPFVIGQQSGATPRSVQEPLPTIATDGAIALCQPFMIATDRPNTNRSKPRSMNEPLATITGSPRLGIVEPFIVPFFGERDGQTPRSHSVDDPLPTVTGQGAGTLIQPFIVPQFSTAGPKSVDDPLGTITTTSRGVGLCEPFITSFYGNGSAVSVEQPLPTATCKERFGIALPMIDGHYIDIRFRMLQPHELSGAMGFPKGYKFTGNREAVVKQIGNAVPTNTAQALCRALLAG